MYMRDESDDNSKQLYVQLLMVCEGVCQLPMSVMLCAYSSNWSCRHGDWLGVRRVCISIRRPLLSHKVAAEIAQTTACWVETGVDGGEECTDGEKQEYQTAATAGEAAFFIILKQVSVT